MKVENIETLENIWVGKWDQLKGAVLKQFGELTSNQVEKAKGSKLKVLGLIQVMYGINREKAQKKLNEIEKKYS